MNGVFIFVQGIYTEEKSLDIGLQQLQDLFHLIHPAARSALLNTSLSDQVGYPFWNFSEATEQLAHKCAYECSDRITACSLIVAIKICDICLRVGSPIFFQIVNNTGPSDFIRLDDFNGFCQE